MINLAAIKKFMLDTFEAPIESESLPHVSKSNQLADENLFPLSRSEHGTVA